VWDDAPAALAALLAALAAAVGTRPDYMEVI
jgi:hypothetical protein